MVKFGGSSTMHTQDKSLEHGFDPTFLYAWKGMRTQNGQEDRLHEYLEICYIMTGKGRQKIEGEIYEVSEGDLIVINAGTYHQAMLGQIMSRWLNFTSV